MGFVVTVTAVISFFVACWGALFIYGATSAMPWHQIYGAVLFTGGGIMFVLSLIGAILCDLGAEMRSEIKARKLANDTPGKAQFKNLPL